MARIAEKCDYAVGTLYQHFGSKEDLLVALSADNSQHRVDLFRRVGEWKAGTRDRMVGIAVADLMFVKLYPEHFRLAQLAFPKWCGRPHRRSAGAWRWKPANRSARFATTSSKRRCVVATSSSRA
ncbi:MAG: helix-turn-helix domain-containing protein [Nevskiales bacterium]